MVHPSSIDPLDVLSQQVAAWSTFAAVVVALCFGIVAERRTRADRRTAAKERERQQATHVSAWAEEHIPPRTPGAKHVYVTYYVHVLNGSVEPIWEVSVDLSSIPETESPCYVGVVPPGPAHAFPAPGGWGRWAVIDSHVAPDPRIYSVGLAFIDHAGRWWHRDQTGRLTKLAERPSWTINSSEQDSS